MKSGAVCFMLVHAHSHFATRNDKKSAFSSHFSCGQGFLIIVLGVQPFFPYPGQQKLPLQSFSCQKNGQPDATSQFVQKFSYPQSYHHSICSSPKCLQTQLKAARNCHVFGTVGGFLSSSGDVACGRCTLGSGDISDRCTCNFCYTKLSIFLYMIDCIRANVTDYRYH